jgi:hypothetical protein
MSSNSAQRQKCGTAENGRPERSERGTLSAVATTVLLAVLFLVSMVPALPKWLRVS